MPRWRGGGDRRPVDADDLPAERRRSARRRAAQRRAQRVAVQTGDAAHPVENIWVSSVFLPDGKVAGLAVHAGTGQQVQPTRP